MNVFPGDTGQASLSEAYLDGEKIIPDHVGPIDAFLVGTNKNLRGKFFEVYTLVTDMPGEPDLTSFRFQLSGGILPYEYYTEKTVQSQGDSVVYKIYYFLYYSLIHYEKNNLAIPFHTRRFPYNAWPG